MANARLVVATFKIVKKLPLSRLCKVAHLLTLADLKLVNAGLFMAHVCRVNLNVFRGGMRGV